MEPALDLLVLPAPGNLIELIRSLKQQSDISFRLFLPSTIENHSIDFPFHTLETIEGETAGDILLKFFKNCTAKLIGLIPSNCILYPHTLSTIYRAMNNRPDVGWCFTDYEKIEQNESTIVHLIEDRGDITEREDRGPCTWIARQALQYVGYIRSGLRFCPLYDLRLRLGEHFRTLHIPKVLVQQKLEEPQMTEEEKARAAKLYFPGQGKLGGFSYLFLHREEEQEIENVFYDSLKRRGAWLEENFFIQECPPDAPLQPNEPIVSVVIPVYNRAKLIGKAIESVQQGTFQQFEIMVVDNASTDNTVSVVKEYIQKDPRIRLLQRSSNVIGEALNDGLFASKGIYLAQLDSDDLYSERTLELAVHALNQDRTIGVAISYYDLVDEDGNVMPEFGIITHSQYNRNNILRRDGAGAARIWRKSVLLEFGGFDEMSFGSYGEDYDMILKCSEKYRVHRIQEVLYHYRRHPDNTDALRHHSLKIWSKTEARQRALIRRKFINRMYGQQEKFE
ncbi:MAG: glycosyltransferase [bacterium]|nr:glycosyltransferase [bacterium]